MDRNPSVSEDELHAFADGQLPEERMSEITAWLEFHPDSAALVTQWEEQNRAIRDALDSIATANEKDRNLIYKRPPSAVWDGKNRWASIAAAVLIYVTGAATGWVLPGVFGPPQNDSTATNAPLALASQAAFRVYVSEIRHPVEVGADQKTHLIAWLTKRLDYPVRLPDLEEFGYNLVGGRLLPVEGQAGALVMYEDREGERMTLMIGRNPDNQHTGFRFNESQGVGTLYWIDGPVGFAVSGTADRADLERVSHAIYSQL